MSISLPNEVQYNTHSSMPSGTTCQQYIVNSSNAQTFGPGSQIIFDLPSIGGMLIPSSMYLRYRATTTKAAAAVVQINGTPLYSFFDRVDTFANSQILESIQSYGMIMNMFVNTKQSTSSKLGNAFGYGLGDNALDGAIAPFTNANTNGRALKTSATTEVISLGGFFPNIISNCDHLVPLGKMGLIRYVITLDSNASVFFGNSAVSFSLSNVELCFDAIQFPAEIDRIVDSQAGADGNITLKSQSYMSSTQSVAQGTTGSELVYNMRLSSIKSLYMLSGFAISVLGGKYDAVDITSSGGSFNFTVAGRPIPNRPISTLNNKAAILQELSLAQYGNVGGEFAITPQEFIINSGGTSTALQPAKCYMGLNVEAIPGGKYLLTGISSNLSSITFRFDGLATERIHTCSLVALYDVLIMVNVMTRQVIVKQ